MSALTKKITWPTSNSGWILFLILAAIALRFFSFFPSELDHDESTYAIIGNEILKGKALYSDVTDTKPAGIFLLYAGLQFLFGYSIFMKRLFAAVIVGLTAFIVRKVSLKLFLLYDFPEFAVNDTINLVPDKFVVFSFFVFKSFKL